MRFKKDVAWAYNNSAEIYRVERRYEESLDEFMNAHDILIGLQREAPNYTQVSYDFAHVLNNTGSLHREFEKFDPAINSYNTALELWNTLEKNDPGSFTLKEQKADTLNSLALVHNRTGAKDTAIGYLWDAFGLYEVAIIEGGFRSVTLERVNNTYSLLRSLCSQNKLDDDSVQLQLRYVEVLRAVAKDDATDSATQLALARQCATAARTFARLNRWDEAIQAFDDCLAVFESLQTMYPANTAYQREIDRIERDKTAILDSNGKRGSSL